MPQRGSAALAVVASLLVSSAALAQSTSPLRVNVYATTQQIECDATTVFLTVTNPAWLNWTCVSGVSYRCRLTTSAVYGVGINYVVANCTQLEIPPPNEIFLNGFEP